MTRELVDLHMPIIELDTAIDGLSALADSQGMKGSAAQDCLNFVANILRHIHSDLEEKYKALEAAEQGSAPGPLHGA